MKFVKLNAGQEYVAELRRQEGIQTVVSNETNSSKPIETPEDIEVREAVEGVLALRKLGHDSHMSTNKSQTHILQKLAPDVLRRVALILAAFEKKDGAR